MAFSIVDFCVYINNKSIQEHRGKSYLLILNCYANPVYTPAMRKISSIILYLEIEMLVMLGVCNLPMILYSIHKGVGNVCMCVCGGGGRGSGSVF